MHGERGIRNPAAARYSVIAALLTVLLAGCVAPPPAADRAKIDRVLVLVGQRLGYMDDVARNKWNSGAPIEDLPREREIIDGLGKQAANYGLDAGIARDFFRAQIEASKIIQHTRFAEWRAKNQPKFAGMRDLAKDIRPALDALTPELMKALAAALPELQTADATLINARAKMIVVVGAADAPARDEAIAPLVRIADAR